VVYCWLDQRDEEAAAVIEAIFGPVVGVLKWLGGLLFKSRAVSHAQAREHDVALFRKGDATMNESFLNDLLNSDLFNHWCLLHDIQTVGHFCTDFKRVENQFLDRKIGDAADGVIMALSAVNSFVGVNFFRSQMPNDRDRLFLHHELRESPDEAKRDRYWKVLVPELNQLLDEAWEAYKNYRSTVRNRLMV